MPQEPLRDQWRVSDHAKMPHYAAAFGLAKRCEQRIGHGVAAVPVLCQAVPDGHGTVTVKLCGVWTAGGFR